MNSYPDPLYDSNHSLRRQDVKGVTQPSEIKEHEGSSPISSEDQNIDHYYLKNMEHQAQEGTNLREKEALHQQRAVARHLLRVKHQSMHNLQTESQVPMTSRPEPEIKKRDNSQNSAANNLRRDTHPYENNGDPITFQTFYTDNSERNQPRFGEHLKMVSQQITSKRTACQFKRGEPIQELETIQTSVQKQASELQLESQFDQQQKASYQCLRKKSQEPRKPSPTQEELDRFFQEETQQQFTTENAIERKEPSEMKRPSREWREPSSLTNILAIQQYRIDRNFEQKKTVPAEQHQPLRTKSRSKERKSPIGPPRAEGGKGQQQQEDLYSSQFGRNFRYRADEVRERRQKSREIVVCPGEAPTSHAEQYEDRRASYENERIRKASDPRSDPRSCNLRSGQRDETREAHQDEQESRYRASIRSYPRNFKREAHDRDPRAAGRDPRDLPREDGQAYQEPVFEDHHFSSSSQNHDHDAQGKGSRANLRQYEQRNNPSNGREHGEHPPYDNTAGDLRKERALQEPLPLPPSASGTHNFLLDYSYSHEPRQDHRPNYERPNEQRSRERRSLAEEKHSEGLMRASLASLPEEGHSKSFSDFPPEQSLSKKYRRENPQKSKRDLSNGRLSANELRRSIEVDHGRRPLKENEAFHRGSGDLFNLQVEVGSSEPPINSGPPEIMTRRSSKSRRSRSGRSRRSPASRRPTDRHFHSIQVDSDIGLLGHGRYSRDGSMGRVPPQHDEPITYRHSNPREGHNYSTLCVDHAPSSGLAILPTTHRSTSRFNPSTSHMRNNKKRQSSTPADASRRSTPMSRSLSQRPPSSNLNSHRHHQPKPLCSKYGQQKLHILDDNLDPDSSFLTSDMAQQRHRVEYFQEQSPSRGVDVRFSNEYMLREKLKAIVEKLNKYKRKIKKQSQEKQDMQGQIHALQKSNQTLQEQATSLAFSQDLQQQVADLKEANSKLQAEVDLERNQLKKSRDSLLDKMTASYEAKLVEQKIITKNLSQENMEMINNIRDKDYLMDKLRIQLEAKEDEEARLKGEIEKLNGENNQLHQEARDFKRQVQEREVESSQKSGVLRSLEGKLMYFDHQFQLYENMQKDFSYCKRLNMQKDDQIRGMAVDLDGVKRDLIDLQGQLKIAQDQLKRVSDHNHQLLKENEYLVKLLKEQTNKASGGSSSDRAQYQALSSERLYKVTSSLSKQRVSSIEQRTQSRIKKEHSSQYRRERKPPSISSVKATDEETKEFKQIESKVMREVQEKKLAQHKSFIQDKLSQRGASMKSLSPKRTSMKKGLNQSQSENNLLTQIRECKIKYEEAVKKEPSNKDSADGISLSQMVINAHNQMKRQVEDKSEGRSMNSVEDINTEYKDLIRKKMEEKTKHKSPRSVGRDKANDKSRNQEPGGLCSVETSRESKPEKDTLSDLKKQNQALEAKESRLTALLDQYKSIIDKGQIHQQQQQLSRARSDTSNRAFQWKSAGAAHLTRQTSASAMAHNSSSYSRIGRLHESLRQDQPSALAQGSSEPSMPSMANQTGQVGILKQEPAASYQALPVPLGAIGAIGAHRPEDPHVLLPNLPPTNYHTQMSHRQTGRQTTNTYSVMDNVFTNGARDMHTISTDKYLTHRRVADPLGVPVPTQVSEQSMAPLPTSLPPNLHSSVEGGADQLRVWVNSGRQSTMEELPSTRQSARDEISRELEKLRLTLNR